MSLEITTRELMQPGEVEQVSYFDLVYLRRLNGGATEPQPPIEHDHRQTGTCDGDKQTGTRSVRPYYASAAT